MKNILKTVICLFLISIICNIDLQAQKFPSDNGDGTYTNPVIAMDVTGIHMVSGLRV